MQQWDDWGAHLNSRWDTLPETILLTLLVLWLSRKLVFPALQVWLTESAVVYHVQTPAQLGQDYQWPKVSPEDALEEVRDGKIHPRCPADGRSLQEDPIIPASPADIDAAIVKASAAQRTWAKTSLSERRRVLRTLLKYILSHQEEIATACCLDSGKTKIDASFGDILVTAEKLQWTIKHGEEALVPSSRPTNLLMCYKENVVLYEPLGVVAACVSWNYPFHNLISPVISALFSGNAIVLKPSEQSCWSSQYFVSFIRGALAACGHSPELVQPVICLPGVANHLTSHPAIKHITFIGSREVAHKVAASASISLTGLTVELGGKDPCIVLDDQRTVAGLDSVLSIILRGVFQAAGQNCIGIERVIALSGIHDKLLARVLPKIQNLRLGSVLLDASPPDMGAMISSLSFAKLEGLIEAAVKAGAILHHGGSRYHHANHPAGTYFQPTLISNVTPNMEIAQIELFAPVFLLMRASSVDHAISIANSTNFALGAVVVGHDTRDVDKCVRNIRAGNVAVNDFGSFYMCSMPFGGRDGSGYGRFGGKEGLKGLCNIKSVCKDTWWARLLRIQTKIPTPLRYPVQGKRGWEACRGVVETGYGVGLPERVKGIRRLVGALMGTRETS